MFASALISIAGDAMFGGMSRCVPKALKSLAAACAAAVLGFPSAFAQDASRSPYPTRQSSTDPAAFAGAGGRGGAGGGATDFRHTGGRNHVSPAVSHVRSSAPPPMDPTRRIYEVDCTRPFDSLGKGNLVCM